MSMKTQGFEMGEDDSREEIAAQLADALAERDAAVARAAELNVALFEQNVRMRRVVAQVRSLFSRTLAP